MSKEKIDHPPHYGGQDNPYEAIKIIEALEALGLDFYLGNCLKYIIRAGRKPGADAAEGLQKSAWYLARAIARLQQKEEGNG